MVIERLADLEAPTRPGGAGHGRGADGGGHAGGAPDERRIGGADGGNGGDRLAPECPASALRHGLELLRPLAAHGDATADLCLTLVEGAVLAATALHEPPDRRGRCADRDCREDRRCETCLLRAAVEHARAAATVARFALASAMDRDRIAGAHPSTGECGSR